MLRRYTNLFVIALAVLLVAKAYYAEAAQVKVPKSKIDRLVDTAIKMYDLELDFIQQYAAAFSHTTGEAGEGLYSEVFNDPVALLQHIVQLDSNNAQAHLYLGKSFQRKAYEGEGNWNKELAKKAREHYIAVINISRAAKVNAGILKEAKEELEDVERMLKE